MTYCVPWNSFCIFKRPHNTHSQLNYTKSPRFAHFLYDLNYTSPPRSYNVSRCRGWGCARARQQSTTPPGAFGLARGRVSEP